MFTTVHIIYIVVPQIISEDNANCAFIHPYVDIKQDANLNIGTSKCIHTHTQFLRSRGFPLPFRQESFTVHLAPPQIDTCRSVKYLEEFPPKLRQELGELYIINTYIYIYVYT